MKKVIIFIFIALAALVSCQKDILEEEAAQQEEARPLVFNISVTSPDMDGTKSVKAGWADGDVVFLFFSGSAAPEYAKMTYNAGSSSWGTTAQNGLSLSDGSGTMTAVYLPFNGDAEVITADDGISWRFAHEPYTYYLTDTKAYTVSGGVVSGSLSLTVPGHVVQFTIPSTASVIPAEEEGRYRLSVTYVAPLAIGDFTPAAGITPDQTLIVGDALPGHVYDGGIQFSGYLPSWFDGVSQSYTFILYDSKGIGHLLPMPGKTLSAGKAIRIKDDHSWYDYSTPEPVNLGLDFNVGSRNIGATVDRANSAECWGQYFAWGETTGHESGSGYTFSAAEYGLANGAMDKLTKYNYDSSKGDEGFTDYKYVLLPADDAATAAYSDPWRIPDFPEFRSMFLQCDKTWDNTNKGIVLTGRGIYSGNSVFIPASGRWIGSLSSTGTFAELWVRDLYNSNPAKAGIVSLNYTCSIPAGSRSFDSRNDGRAIRPIFDNTPDPPTHDIMVPGKVDMGLPSGTKWATWNLGATTEEEPGLYFAWGDTMGYTEEDGITFEWYNYKYSAYAYNTLTKYNPTAANGYEGFTDALTTLEAADDAASVLLPEGTWRTPTADDWDELRNSSYTTWSWDGTKNGYLVTSKVNSNTIFLPVTGRLTTVGVVDASGTSGVRHWSSSVYVGRSYQATYNNSNTSYGTNSRCEGLPIRPVCD